MKKNFTVVAVAVSVLASLSLGSCKKDNLTPMENGSEAQTALNKSYTNYEGIMSNNGYPVAGQTEMGYYSTASPSAPGAVAVPYMPFGGAVTSTVKGLAATSKLIVFAYVNASDGNTYLNFGHTAITPANYSDAGTDLLVLLNGVSTFNYAIEEIEIDPISRDVYTIVRNGNAIQLYRIDGLSSATAGTATLMTNAINGTASFFYNPLGNGYKWGSICFVPNASNPATNDLVFSSESTVYAAYGIVSWHFSIAGNTVTPLVSSHRTYSVSSSGFPAGTGINTTYANTFSGTKKFLIMRDNGSVYSFSLTANNTPATLEYNTAGLGYKTDIGYWGNH